MLMLRMEIALLLILGMVAFIYFSAEPSFRGDQSERSFG